MTKAVKKTKQGYVVKSDAGQGLNLSLRRSLQGGDILPEESESAAGIWQSFQQRLGMSLASLWAKKGQCDWNTWCAGWQNRGEELCEACRPWFGYWICLHQLKYGTSWVNKICYLFEIVYLACWLEIRLWGGMDEAGRPGEDPFMDRSQSGAVVTWSQVVGCRLHLGRKVDNTFRVWRLVLSTGKWQSNLLN